MKFYVMNGRASCITLALGCVLAACSPADKGTPQNSAQPDATPTATVRRDAPESIDGAIYIPANAYNAPQMWKNFDANETDRDLGYANKIHLNALRSWASYEYWKMDPKAFQDHFDQYLAIAQKHGIRILVSLFENDGVQPTQANMWSTDPATAVSVQSPGEAISTGPESGWEDPRKFLTWFMNRYKNDDRLLAIEVMNEPREALPEQPVSIAFAKSMLQTAKSLQGTVPLTMGTDKIPEIAAYIPLGIDVIEFHDNFGPSVDEMKDTIQKAMAVGKKANLPVWLTEWQRTRPSGSGWGDAKVDPKERGIDYASLAPTVRSYPVGNFFWSLMVKRAYLPGQRKKGTVNGLFWPDGSVLSLSDARAISGDPTLTLPEKPLGDFGLEGTK